MYLLEEAEKILFEIYNITGEASKLPGEIDANFKIKIDKKNRYILKISAKNTDKNELDFQQKILQYLTDKNTSLITPKVILDKNKKTTSTISINGKSNLQVRLLSWIDGRVWSSVNPQLNNLRFSLGEKAGELTNNLQGFNHPEANREFVWDVAQVLWTKKYLHLFNKEDKNLINSFIHKFETCQIEYKKLRKSIVHNDANDNNVLVSEDFKNPKTRAIIDFGDAINTQIINDVAITCAYAIMDKNNPLEASLPIIKGYHSKFPLQEKELQFLYTLIAMRLIISITKSAINKIDNPENKYLLISEKPAWDLLKKWKNISEDFAHFSFRNTCGLYCTSKSS